MSSNPKDKFEMFLDSLQNKEQANWFRDLPTVLEGIVKTIKEVYSLLEGTEKLEKFERNTISKLRTLYSDLRVIIKSENHNYNEMIDSKEIVKLMISQINSWFRSTKIACGIKISYSKKLYGKASLAEKFEFITGDDFTITGNQW